MRLEIRVADVPEVRAAGEAPESFARRLAREKALAIAQKVGRSPRRFILGADTIVVLGDSVLGKPRDADHAFELLNRIVGREHRVITAIALVDSGSLVVRDAAVASRVRMRTAAESELRDYVKTGEALDKAGAYALQGRGRRFVSEVVGSESNVIGLPLEETLELLRGAGFAAVDAEGQQAESRKGQQAES